MESQGSTYLTEAEVADRLQYLEAKYDLFQYRVGGYNAWQQLRFDVASRLGNLPRVAKPANLRSKWLNNRMTLVLPELLRFLVSPRSDYVIRTVSSALREKEKGLYKDIYFDDLIKELGCSFYKIERINNQIYDERRRSALIPSTMTTFTVDLLAELLTRLPASAEAARVADQISAILRSELNFSVLTPTYIVGVYKRFYWLKRLYRGLLRRIQPRYVLVESTRGGYPIWAAARELGISTVEFQHGIFSRNHPEALPASASSHRPSLILPDKFFLFGEYWKDELKKNRFYEHELVPVGSPQIDYYRMARTSLRKAKPPDGMCTILLTTQGLSQDDLIQYMTDFRSLAQSKLKYVLYIKLHPVHEKDKSPYVQAFGSDPNVHILLGSEDPSTFELLSRADFHLSVASTVHYDSLGLGVPTVVLPLAGHDAVLNLVKSGHAYLARTPEDLLAFISNSAETSVPPEVSAYYYTPNAVQNMMRELI